MAEVVVLPKQEFKEMKEEINRMKEALAVVMDRELMKSIKRGMKDIEEGRVIPHEEIKKKYHD